MSAFVTVSFDDLFLKLNDGSFSDEDEEEEEKERSAAVVETDFDFLEFVRR